MDGDAYDKYHNLSSLHERTTTQGASHQALNQPVQHRSGPSFTYYTRRQHASTLTRTDSAPASLGPHSSSDGHDNPNSSQHSVDESDDSIASRGRTRRQDDPHRSSHHHDMQVPDNKYNQKVFCTSEDIKRWDKEGRITHREARKLKAVGSSGTDTANRTGGTSHQEDEQMSRQARYHRYDDKHHRDNDGYDYY